MNNKRLCKLFTEAFNKTDTISVLDSLKFKKSRYEGEETYKVSGKVITYNHPDKDFTFNLTRDFKRELLPVWANGLAMELEKDE